MTSFHVHFGLHGMEQPTTHLSTSGNWQTVSIPLSEFAYDRYGNKLGGLKFENLTGMTMFLYTGPYKEATVECSTNTLR